MCDVITDVAATGEIAEITTVFVLVIGKTVAIVVSAVAIVTAVFVVCKVAVVVADLSSS